MRRRSFITGLLGTALTRPSEVRLIPGYVKIEEPDPTILALFNSRIEEAQNQLMGIIHYHYFGINCLPSTRHTAGYANLLQSVRDNAEEFHEVAPPLS